MYKAILWDVDGTLLNFLKSENAAIKECFQHFGLPECTDEMVGVYSAINEGYWKLLERGRSPSRSFSRGGSAISLGRSE